MTEALAEGVVVQEACVGETTNESCNNGGGCVSCLPNVGGVEQSQNAGQAPTATKEDGVRERLLECERGERDNEKPPATRKRARSPPSQSGDYDDPSPCAALRV